MPDRVNETLHEPLGVDEMVLEQSRRRYRNGRRIMLISAAIFALSRALYFLPSESRPELPAAIQLLTFIVPIWVWIAAWSLVVVLCVRDLFRKQGRVGIGALIGMLFAWGAVYLLSYVVTVINEGFGSSEWATFAWYAGIGGVVFGLVMKVGALKRRGEDV